MTKNRTTKTRTVTYMGRRAQVTETRLDGGHRLVETHWLDDATPANGGHAAGTRVIREVSGDGRVGSLIVHSERIETL